VQLFLDVSMYHRHETLQMVHSASSGDSLAEQSTKLTPVSEGGGGSSSPGGNQQTPPQQLSPGGPRVLHHAPTMASSRAHPSAGGFGSLSHISGKQTASARSFVRSPSVAAHGISPLLLSLGGMPEKDAMQKMFPDTAEGFIQETRFVSFAYSLKQLSDALGELAAHLNLIIREFQAKYSRSRKDEGRGDSEDPGRDWPMVVELPEHSFIKTLSRLGST